MSGHVENRNERSLLAALLGDGRFLLALTAVALIASGGFALFLCVTGHFLPHDVQALGFDAAQLARAGNRALVSFMFHDRAAFGGSLIAIGALYWWLVEFPLRERAAWAWWTIAVSGALGFASFLSYLGYGYLDTWHGVATLFLLPMFAAGLIRAWRDLSPPKSMAVLWRPAAWREAAPAVVAGRRLLLAYGAGLLIAGATISAVGVTSVFVETDLRFIQLTRLEICGISERLLPVIAHDRAGFGGGLICIGVVVLSVVWHAPGSRSFREIMLASAVAGFGAAIGVHFVVGYTDAWHLAPAFAGALIFFSGWTLAGRAGATKRSVPSLTAETQKADA